MDSECFSGPGHNIPTDLTTFVGRQHESDDVRRLITAHRLVTLTGPGGVGKTRLAATIAADLHDSFINGAWMIELDQLSDTSLLVHTINATLGIRSGADHDVSDSLRDHLEHKHTLIVLDNCEHVIDGCGELIHSVIRRCPRVRFLVTSRQPLGLIGERIVQVNPLSIPPVDCIFDFDETQRYEAVTLFADRASAVRPRFSITEENYKSVARICQQLDGVPLAIELAAVLIRALTLQDIERRLSDLFRTLARGHRMAPTRQQTLRASVEWSFDLCSPQEQTLWAQLSVFVRGFDLDAAEAVCAGAESGKDEVFPLIASLIDKSIIMLEERSGVTRYRMLEILRAYGQEHLAATDLQGRTRSRHQDWYAAMASSLQDHWIGGDQRGMLTALTREHANLRAALSLSLVPREDNTIRIRIASDLQHYWMARGLVTEGRYWLKTALDSATPEDSARAAGYRVCAYLAIMQGDSTPAQALLDEALVIARASSDRRELAHITMVAGLRSMCMGDPKTAAAQFEDALPVFNHFNDAGGAVYCTLMLQAAVTFLGDLDQAASLHLRCMEITQPAGEEYFRSFSLWMRGVSAIAQGDLAAAEIFEKDGLRLKRGLDDHFGQVLCIEALGWSAARGGRFERAALLLGAGSVFWGPMQMALAALPGLQRFRRDCEATLRNGLDDKDYELLRRRGAALSGREAVTFALSDWSTLGSAPPDEPTPLTTREAQIAEMVMDGLTNKQIATRLSVAQRTAEAHIQHILTKLGFTGRAQIAAWAARRNAVSPTPGSVNAPEK
jgi:predicted ATPase/DNA-binding CsgD family transcriptional regulator